MNPTPEQVFQEAQQSGQLKPEMDPLLAATMLFGAIEMGLTAFVLGLLDKKNDEALDKARDQVVETFLRGVLSRPKEEAWTAPKSPTASSTARRS